MGILDPIPPRHLLLLLAALGAAACISEPSLGPGLHVIAGSNATGAAGDTLRTRLIVEVRDSTGRPAAHTPVLFVALPNDSLHYFFGAYFASPNDFLLREYAAIEAGADGRAALTVVLGPLAGPARVVITAPMFGLQDTVHFVVTAGPMATVVVEPADTAVYAGAHFALRATTLDRYGNQRDDAVTFRTSAVNATVDASGGVRALAIGRVSIVAAAGARTDTAWLSVVPTGTIAAFARAGAPQFCNIVITNLDGSGYRRLLASGLGLCLDASPTWAPSGDTIVYSKALDYWPRLLEADLGGLTRRVTSTDTALTSETWPSYSRDGTWVYFTGLRASSMTIWRVHPDGSGLEQIEPTESSFQLDTHPSPSPDGTRVVYVSSLDGFLGLRIVEPAIGAVTRLNLPGITPRWSPTGDRIAYVLDGVVRVVRPDGSGRRAVSAPASVYEYGSSGHQTSAGSSRGRRRTASWSCWMLPRARCCPLPLRRS